MKWKDFPWVTFSLSNTPVFEDYGWFYILPSIEYKHKYRYLWQFAFTWGWWGFTIDICRKDWNTNNQNQIHYV